jgi:hypothetical protein
MIEFEHTIFILLLLVGVLNAKPAQQKLGFALIVLGILLVFIPPAQVLDVPWKLGFGLVIPLLLWQNIRRIVNADWGGRNSVALWAVSALIFSFVFLLGDSSQWVGALLFGVVTASMVWRASEPENSTSYMSQIGPMTLIFLLTEVEIAIQTPDHYLGGIFSGGFFGLLAAALGLYLLQKARPNMHPWIGIGQVYLAYWFSFFIGSSAVTAAFVSVIIFVWVNQYHLDGFDQETWPAPLNTWPGFGLTLVLFLFLGWQAHQLVSPSLLVRVFVGSLVSLGIILVGRHYQLAAFQDPKPLWLSGLRVTALIFPWLLIWPSDVLNQPIQLAVAIGISMLVVWMSYMGVTYWFPKKNTSKIKGVQ